MVTDPRLTRWLPCFIGQPQAWMNARRIKRDILFLLILYLFIAPVHIRKTLVLEKKLFD